MWTGNAYHILEALFEEVDAFEADPAIRDSDMIDEAALRDAAARSLTLLDAIAEK